VRPQKTFIACAQLLLIGWASLWVMALPLFHTHLPGIFQPPIGVPHTVFSPDLPGEYSAFSHKTSVDASQLSVLASSSPELGFVASPEDDKRNPLIQPIYAGSLLFLPACPGATVGLKLLLSDSHSCWSPHAHWFRGPPLSISL